MKREEQRRRVLKLCTEIQKTDDALGQFSDYEGEDNGPTWDAYKNGYLARRALEAIQLHRKAIAIWGQLYNLARHKPAAEMKS